MPFPINGATALKPVKGLFLGLATIDLQYLLESYPAANTKTKAQAFTMQTGGPAANAAMTFSHLGGRARLYTLIGQHPFRAYMLDEFARFGVEVVDMADGLPYQPPLSSVVTASATGSRTIFNGPLPHRFATTGAEPPWVGSETPDVVVIDGFLHPAAGAMASHFAARGVPVVLDGGSWKDATPELLEIVDVAICSETFHPPGHSPGMSTPEKVMADLGRRGVEHVAVTRGERPILYRTEGGVVELPVPRVEAVDTLGAGDIFHGAFAYYFARGSQFADALDRAGAVAARSCRSFGTRAWMREEAGEDDLRVMSWR